MIATPTNKLHKTYYCNVNIYEKNTHTSFSR